MMIRSVRGGALITCLLLSACLTQVEWRDHASFRASRTDLALAHVGPEEVVQNVISRNLHYVSIAIDTVFFRNLPGLFGAEVALGLEIQGARRDGRPIKTVLDVQPASPDDGFLSFDNVAVVEPFLYTGRNITITLHFKAVAKKASAAVRGRLAGAGDVIKKLSPTASSALEVAGSLFDSVIGAFFGNEQQFKYSFTLYPADSVYRDKPELLFTAARHILISVPPPGSPPKFHKFLPSKIMPLLKLRGNRLVYRSTNEEYTETPYIILNVTRYRRYPKEDTELRKVAARVDAAIEQGNLKFAQENMRNLAVAINNDQVITQQEKDLERSWLEIREADIKARRARQRGEWKTYVKEQVRQVRYLVGMKKYFRQILEPFEIKKIDFQIRTAARRTQDVAADKSVPVPGRLAKLLAEDKEADRRIAVERRKARVLLSKAMAKRKKMKYTQIDPEGYFTYQPLYKKWWFWTAILGVAGVTVGTTLLLNPKDKNEPTAVLP